MASTSATPTAQQPYFIPTKLSLQTELAVFRRQRKICGWGLESLALWQDHISDGTRTLFWLGLPADTPHDASEAGVGVLMLDHSDTPFLAVGHIALDSVDIVNDHVEMPEHTLAPGDRSVMTIASLFVLPDFSKHGLGRFGIDSCTAAAREEPYGSPHCRAVTVNTLHPKHCKGGLEGPEGMGVFDRMGWPVQDHSMATWFERMGYGTYKEGPRYQLPAADGSGVVNLWCKYMRKELA